MNAECHYAECHYAECHYAECHYAECHMPFALSVVMLNVVKRRACYCQLVTT